MGFAKGVSAIRLRQHQVLKRHSCRTQHSTHLHEPGAQPANLRNRRLAETRSAYQQHSFGSSPREPEPRELKGATMVFHSIRNVFLISLLAVQITHAQIPARVSNSPTLQGQGTQEQKTDRPSGN